MVVLGFLSLGVAANAHVSLQSTAVSLFDRKIGLITSILIGVDWIISMVIPYVLILRHTENNAWVSK